MTDDYAQYSLDTPVRRRAECCTVPLTSMQLWGWNYYCRDGNFRSGRMCATSLRITGALDHGILARCVGALARRHEALRTRIVLANGIPQQLIDPPGDHLLHIVDLSKVERVSVESALKQQTQLFVKETIDLSLGPLFEAKLWRLSPNDHVLIIMLDHIVSDGASYAIINREIWDLYERGLSGRPIALPELPIQFADYVVWRQCTEVDWTLRNEAYWQQRLNRPTNAQIPHDYLPSNEERQVATTCVVPLGTALAGELRKFARQQMTLLSLVVLSIYIFVLSRWCKQDDLIVRFVTHGRHGKRELFGVVGFLASHLYLRVQITADDTPIDILKKTRMEFQSALEHQDFDRIPYLCPQCSSKMTFNWQSARHLARSVAGVTISEYSTGITGLDLPFYNVDDPVAFAPAFFDDGSDISVLIYYRPDLLSAKTVQQFVANLRTAAEIFMSCSTTPVAAISFADTDV